MEYQKITSLLDNTTTQYQKIMNLLNHLNLEDNG